MLDQTFISACAASLRLLAEDVEKVQTQMAAEVKLTYGDFSASFPDAQLRELISWAGKNPVIYKFTVVEGSDSASILERFIKRKAKEKARAYCKANLVSNTLYVGSSLNLESRLQQHFGYSGRTTYSMQLIHWLQVGDIETLHLSVWKLAGLPKLTVQALEDYLWDQERPLLGKRGGR